MNTPTDKSIPAQAAYCRAYSVWLLFEGPWPNSDDFGIDYELSLVLRRQCRAMHHKQLDAQRPAVSFTEAEARRAAEDLREAAAVFCEYRRTNEEAMLRLLAQKFDTWRREV